MKVKGLALSGSLPEEWIVDCKHVGQGTKALIYVGKYLYRGVLQKKDLVECRDAKVTFHYKEKIGKVKARTLPGIDFLWLLLQNVLPNQFRRVRDYEFLHSNSKPLIQLLHYLLRGCCQQSQNQHMNECLYCVPYAAARWRILCPGQD